MKRATTWLGLVTAVGILHAADAEAAFFDDGRTVQAGRTFGPNQENLIASVAANFVVGPGTELIDFGGITRPEATYPGFVDIDLSANTILLTASRTQQLNVVEEFRLFDISGEIPRMTGVIVNPETNWPNFDEFLITPAFDNMILNLGGAQFVTQGQVISLTVLPEPATAGLIFGSAAMFAAVARERARRK